MAHHFHLHIIRILFFLLFPFLGLSQNNTCAHKIQGKVVDADTKEPIPHVTVQIKDSQKFTITDENGVFSIEELCSNENILIISCLGYCESVCNHEHHHDHEHDNTPHFYLTQKFIEIESVTILAERGKKKGIETLSQNTLHEADLISFNPTQSLASSISGQQGVSMTSTGMNVQLPVIHGLYGNRIFILNNGFKHGFQNWGTDHAPEIDIRSAHAITIIKGAAGVQFGPEALGGALIIEPNPLLLNDPLYTKINTGYETNGKGYNTGLETGLGLKKWSYFLNGNYTKIGDRHTPDYFLTNSGKEEKSFGAGTRLHHEHWDFNIYYSYIDQNLALLRASVAESGNALANAINSDKPDEYTYAYPSIQEPNQLTEHHLGKAEINWWYSDEGKVSFRMGRQLNHRQEYDVRRNAHKPIIDLNLNTSDYQLNWKHPKWFDLDGLIGVQYFSQKNGNNYGTGTVAFIPNYETVRYSAFIKENINYNKNTFEAGLRFDQESNYLAGVTNTNSVFRDYFTFSNTSFSVGHIKQFNSKSSWRTNIGVAWRPPTMAELYSFGKHGFKSTYGLLRYYFDSTNKIKTDRVLLLEESTIKAEKGYKLISEFHTHNENNTHTITAYSHYIENYIYSRPIAIISTVRGPEPGYITEQTNAGFIGLDYTWKKEWTQSFSGTAGLSYLWSKDLTDNQPLLNQPPIRINYELTWQQKKLWKLDDSKFTIKPSYTFPQFNSPRVIPPETIDNSSVILTSESEIFDFKETPQGYFLLNLGWQFSWKDIQANIFVKNILNTRYRDYLNEMRYFVDEPGRNIVFSLNYTFKAKQKSESHDKDIH